MKTAILQVADSGPLESLVEMLESVGYTCFLPGEDLKTTLRGISCDTVVDIQGLVENWGYELPCDGRLPPANLDMLRRCDLYVDVKAHRNGPKVWRLCPRLQSKTLWYRINGGKPEHVIRRDGFDCGDEANPPCPILTPNQWYKAKTFSDTCDTENIKPCPIQVPWAGKAYVCWPPFVRFDEYLPVRARPNRHYNLPICLVHNLAGWGYGKMEQPLKSLNVQLYGRGSPHGLISHSHVPILLSRAVAMVHLKSSDAPGYALYEALAAGCPVICSRRFIWRNRMEELLTPNQTCLVFDRETHDALSDIDAEDCANEIAYHLDRLHDSSYNHRIGYAGRERLEEVMWSKDKEADREGLREFMERHFG